MWARKQIRTLKYCFFLLFSVTYNYIFSLQTSYRQILLHTRQTLNSFQQAQQTASEFLNVNLPPPSASELVSSDIILQSLIQAVNNSQPCPAQPFPFIVNVPPIPLQNDPEFTAVLQQSPNAIPAFETTNTIQQFTFEPEKEPAQNQTQNNQTKFTSQQGPCQLKKFARPPSHTEVRQIAKQMQAREQSNATMKIDLKTLKNERLGQMQQILSSESKQGRKMDTLPDTMKYVVSDSGKIVGVAQGQPKAVGELAQNEMRIQKDDKKKKAEKVAETPKENLALDEAGKKIQEGLYGKGNIIAKKK
ncbi:Conserved_hypothetical protein [Hexamita inflata]|uniref:Uncharacterized protein n=1 Tax=Hexamita inflata TaxID=28002 RepID=A0ABP1GHW7_9EUKA